MSEPGKAVFLSYASQDAEAAKRICDALRAAGVEVWFDQSELVGGDQWDGKIRGQIGSCALFMPIISANTQARREGYFRVEWKLAAQRTHAMADGTPFLLPVLIDGTRDAEALVPAEFKSVQWTKLPGGDTPPAFAQRVKKLLDGNVGASLDDARGSAAPDGRRQAAPLQKTGGPSKWWWALPIFGVTMALLLVMKEKREASPPASRLPLPASAAPSPPPSVARQLADKARAVFENLNASTDDFALAEDYCKQAVKLDADDAYVWAVYAELSGEFIGSRADESAERFELARTQAERALKLAPNLPEARFAKACYLRRLPTASVADAEKILRELLVLMPDDPRVLIGLAKVIGQESDEKDPRRTAEALELLDRAATIPSGRAWALDVRAFQLILRGRTTEAEAAADGALAVQFVRNAAVKKIYLAVDRGDFVTARDVLAKVPADVLRTDQGAFVATRLWLWSREPARCLEVLAAVNRDYLSSTYFRGPTDLLRGQAYQMAGKAAAARTAWQAALQVVDKRLGRNPQDPSLLHNRANLLALLGDSAGAATALQLYDEVNLSDGHSMRDLAVRVYSDPPGRALDLLETLLERKTSSFYSALNLRFDPQFDPLRDHPRFQKLLAESMTPSPAHPLGADAKSVAVLAFANLSDDKANEYFSDGISEELLNVLAKVPKLKVAARTSSFYFKGKDTPIPEIAQKLGVAYVVEGSVRKSGNKVRITAQLIKAADGFHVWSETYDRDLTDIFAVQDEIAKNILGIVRNSVLGETELPHTTTTKIEAYTLFLQAQGQFARRGEAGLREAIRLYEAALGIDPNYVPALVGLAQARVVLPNYAYLSGAKARETTDAAIKAAHHALELDPQNAAAFAVIGWAKFQFDWQWAESGVALRHARDLAPNDSWTWNCLGDYLRFVGEFSEALVAKQREWDLDPLSPNSHWDLAYVYLVAGNYDQAIHWSEICIGLSPHNIDSYAPAILAAGRSGRLDLMRRMLTALRQNVHGNEGMVLLLEANGAILEKKPEEARRLLAAASPSAENENTPPGYLGYLYLLLGDTDQAVAWLQKGCDRHDPSMVWSENVDLDVIAANPKTRPILDQPGLKELYELRQRNARAGLSKL